METAILIVTIVLTLLVGVLSVLTLRNRKKGQSGDIEALEKRIRETESTLKTHVETVNRLNTEGLLRGVGQNNETLLKALTGISDGNEQRMVQLRTGTLESLEGVRRQLEEELEKVRKLLSENLNQLRAEQEKALGAVRAENKEQMDAMRGVVDEKLQKTLNERLTQSFNAISERLEAVQKGLGEMKELSGGVNDLKRVLTNVKTRGTWGETSLESLLSDILTSEQYERNAAVSGRASQERVDFAVRLPADGNELLLPIDVKFPVEDYQRLLDATNSAEAAEAQKALVNAVKRQARSIRDKYVKPPKTTDFAIMYLPMEGLYAEVLKEAGLVEQLQNDYKIVPAGPTTVAALLNSLRMGFRSLAIQKSSREIFDLMRRITKEFDAFLDAVEKTRTNITRAGENLEQVSNRSNKLRQSLQRVEAISPPDENNGIA